MNSKLIAAIAAASVLGSATLVAASGDDHGHRKGPKFSIEEMDTNGDQMISKDEISAHAKVRFDQVDQMTTANCQPMKWPPTAKKKCQSA